MQSNLRNVWFTYKPVIIAFLALFCVGLPISIFIQSINEGTLNLFSASRSTPWGVFTSLFINLSFPNFFNNFLAIFAFLLFFILGNNYLQQTEKRKRNLFSTITIFVSAIIANIIWVVANPNPAFGASGITFSLAGVVLVFALFNLADANQMKGQKKYILIQWLINPLAIVFVLIEVADQFANAVSLLGLGVNVLVHLWGFLVSAFFIISWIIIRRRKQVKTTQTNKGWNQKFRILSENSYLILFFCLTIIISSIFLVLGLTTLMEYNLAVGLFTSFFTTGITVLFLNIFLNYRQMQEWKRVKNTIYLLIGDEISCLFSGILDLVKMDVGKLNLDAIQDNKIIRAKLDEFKKGNFNLEPNYPQKMNHLVNAFTAVRSNIADFQIRYGGIIKDYKFTEQLTLLNDAIDEIKLLYEENSKTNSHNKQLKLVPFDFDCGLLESMLPDAIRNLAVIISNFWDLGIQFNFISDYEDK